MPAHITMWCYLWDLVDEGIDAVLREMKEELGLTALSVATHYHSVEHYRPHTKGAFIYRDDSALYFPPGPRLLSATRLRHRVSPLAHADDRLSRVAEAAATLGLDLISWTICCHSSYLGRTYPEATIHNALGDHYPEALCPANPEVRGFLTGLVADLTHRYGVALAELESCEYAASRHFHHHEKIAVPPRELDHFLMGLCFCPHCLARGEAEGADAPRVRAAVAEAVRRSFASGEPHPGTVAEFIAATPGLAAYVRGRVAAVSSLLREIVAASACPVSPIAWASPEASGLDAGEAAAATGSLTVTAYTPDPDAARRMIREAATPAGGVGRLRVGFHTFPPVAPDRETLLRVIEASLDEGVRAFSFYNYGIAPRRSLGWVRDAAAMIHRRVG